MPQGSLAPQPLQNDSGHIWGLGIHFGSGEDPELGSRGGGSRKGRNQTQNKLQNQGGSPKAGLQGLCNSLAMGSDTLLLPLPFLQQLGQVSLGLQLQELYSGQGTSDCCPLTPGPQCLN